MYHVYIGHDNLIDLTQGWLLESYPLDLNKLSPQQLSNISLLYGGVGDGE